MSDTQRDPRAVANDEMRARARKRKWLSIATGLLLGGHEHCVCSSCEDRIVAALQAEYERGKRERTQDIFVAVRGFLPPDAEQRFRAAFGLDETTGEAVSR